MSTQIESHDQVRFCKFCRSEDIKKRGVRHNKSGEVQRYKCGSCGKAFTANFGFRYRRYSPEIVSEAMHLYFSGTSSNAIADLFETRGIDIDGSTVRKWVKRYSKVAHLFTDSITPDVGKWYRADEVWVKVDGKKHYLFATMDDDTRYWLAGELADSKDKHDADNIFRMTKQHAGGKNPTVLISDKLPAYQKAARKIFGNGTYHKADAGLRSKRKGPNGGSSGNYHPSNNKMERLNGTIRDREKTFRGLGTDTPVFDGMRVHYNHCRRHDSIAKTPAEAAGIHTEGRNKWKTIIQNASLHLYATGQWV